MLLKHALPEFGQNKGKMCELFGLLWGILLKAAADPEAGEVIFVLDALDECEESGRIELIERLHDFFINDPKEELNKTRLKFLVTSRPYYDIERSLKPLTSAFPSVHLTGENETDLISREIEQVIRAKVQETGDRLRLADSVRASLEKKLLSVTHCTYLWLTLILDVINNQLQVTEKRLRRIIDTLPDTIDNAYTAILDRSTDRPRAKKLLHIVVAARYPLSLRDMNIALAVQEDSRSYEDLDLEPEELFHTTLRNLCGLLVSVSDSRIFLIHQTAKEFLIRDEAIVTPSKQSIQNTGYWKHSLQPAKSNLILAKSSISYLLFDVFGSTRYDYEEYTALHGFFGYARVHWISHFETANITHEIPLTRSALRLCDPRSKQFDTWITLPMRHHWYYWQRDKSESGFTLHVISFLGLESLVRFLLERGVDINERTKGEYNCSPLSIAVALSHINMVRLLLENGADPNLPHLLGSGEKTVLNSTTRIVDHFISYFSPYSLSSLRASDEAKNKSLCGAAWVEIAAIARLLVEKTAKIKGTYTCRQTALHDTNLYDSEILARRLLKLSKKWHCLNLQDVRVGDTIHTNIPFDASEWGPFATFLKKMVTIRLLLEHGADPSIPNKQGKVALEVLFPDYQEILSKEARWEHFTYLPLPATFTATAQEMPGRLPKAFCGKLRFSFQARVLTGSNRVSN